MYGVLTIFSDSSSCGLILELACVSFCGLVIESLLIILFSLQTGCVVLGSASFNSWSFDHSDEMLFSFSTIHCLTNIYNISGWSCGVTKRKIMKHEKLARGSCESNSGLWAASQVCQLK